MADFRAAVVQWCSWAVANKSLFNYQLIRPIQLFVPTPERHITNDCSGTVCWVYCRAGAPDPMGFGYKDPAPGEDEGNTDTLAARGTPIPVGEAQPGDVVVYWPPWDTSCSGASQHTAIVIQGGSDPRTMSHGQPSEPAFVYVSQDGRPHRYFRFLPITNQPTPIPTPIPQPVPEEDMNLIVEYDNGFWVVRADLSGKHAVATPADGTALENCGLYRNVALSATQMAAIPNV